MHSFLLTNFANVYGYEDRSREHKHPGETHCCCKEIFQKNILGIKGVDGFGNSNLLTTWFAALFSCSVFTHKINVASLTLSAYEYTFTGKAT